MEFRKETRRVQFLSPAAQFEPEVHHVEYRADPLTGAQSRINVRRAERVRQAQREEVDLGQVIEETRRGCFFCPENIEQMTPRFPPHISSRGRIERGDCLIFPNLFPFAENHAVGTLGREHFPALDEFTPEVIRDNVLAATEYIATVYSRDGRARYPMWLWNHLPPSAASIIHPHVQIVVDGEPPPELARLLRRSEEYFAQNGTNYWDDLVAEERRLGQRYIGDVGPVAVVASFAPRGNREVQLIFRGLCSLGEVAEEQAMDFATAVVKILRSYKAMGVNSFNLITYSAPLGHSAEFFRLSARIISRPFFAPFYTSDCGFMERFYDVWVIETLPEDVAADMRTFF